MAGRESVVCGNACLIVINHFRKLPGNFQKDVDPVPLLGSSRKKLRVKAGKSQSPTEGCYLEVNLV